MIKRITAIMALVLTLCLFAFPVFAAALDSDEIRGDLVYTISGYCDFYDGSSTVYIDYVTLPEGLYIIDIDGQYPYDDYNDAGFYIQSASGSGRFSYSFPPGWGGYDIWDGIFYVYITAPFEFYFFSNYEYWNLGLYTINIYSTVFNDKYDEGFEAGKNQGYTLGHIDGYDKGYGLGYTDGERAGYDDAIDSAREQVYENAYNTGYFDGNRDGVDTGYDLGYEGGYSTGVSDGYSNGSTDGYNEGYSVGKSEGYSEGRQTAQDAAYAEGKQDGWNEAIQDSEEVKTAIGGIFSGIFDGCVDSFNELTEGVTLMGITLKQILLTIVAIGIIGVCIWLFALKK